MPLPSLQLSNNQPPDSQTKSAGVTDIMNKLGQLIASSGIAPEALPALLGGEPTRQQAYPQWPIAGLEETNAIARVLASGRWGGAPYPGPETQTFAAQFLAMQLGEQQAKTDAESDSYFAIPMMNGTLTLEVALRAASIGWGDEVIVPAYTFQATATAPIAIGAIPVMVDVDAQTYCISPEAIEAAITPRTRAIIPVHLGAQMADMDAIMAIAERHNLIVVEDCAHAHGAQWNGRGAGTIGHFGSFSLQSSKLLTTGEGGVLICRERAVAQRVISLINCGRTETGETGAQMLDRRKNDGQDSEQVMAERITGLIQQMRSQMMPAELSAEANKVGVGSNYRMTELQAALGQVALTRFDAQQIQRAQMMDYLEQQLPSVPGVKLLKRDDRHTKRSVYRYIFAIDPEVFGLEHQALSLALQFEGIACWQGYPALHHHDDFQPLHSRLPVPSTYPDYFDFENMGFPETERASESEAIWLEESVFRAGKQGIDDVITALKKLQESAALLSAAKTYFLEVALGQN